jgi:hypothetical protein
MRGRSLVVVIAVLALGTLGASVETHVARADPRPQGCNKVHNLDFPDSTRFPYVVPFQVGKTDLGAGDDIVIKEVLGTKPSFEVGGIYLVRGEYRLGSADESPLYLNVTATARGEGCTSGNPRGQIVVRRGAGTFELASPIPYEGWPHVWFGAEPHTRGVYFGAGAFLNK